MELPNRSGYEATFKRGLADLSRKQMEEFQRLLGDPPDPANIPLAFWADVEAENRRELEEALLLIFLASAVFHGGAKDAMSPLARSWAIDQSRKVSAQYTATGARMADTMGRDLEVKLRGLAGRGEEPGAELDRWTRQRLNSIFGPDRIERLAVNEVTIAQTEGGEAGVRETVGISPDDKWRTNPQLSRTGPCPICLPLNGKKRTEWGEFSAGPPAHPSCVCDVVYANLPEIRTVRRR